MTLTVEQWLLGALAALLVGFSKTGVPGVGILVVPLMAIVFQDRAAVGTTVLLLIFADLFAVYWYRRYTRWDKLLQLLPWVALGMLIGMLTLLFVGEDAQGRDQINVWIGALVLIMLAVHLARLKWGDRLRPSSRVGLAATGSAAGFATTVSNAAGPIMSIYMTGLGLPKHEFMGTTAWYFLIFNVAKVPLYLVVMSLAPERPLFTLEGLIFDAFMLPVIVIGVLVGRWALPRIPQEVFNGLALGLAALAALRLILMR
ncbi:MAG: sulfite exporter TauE/SafE family protein [Thermoflexales bacterium]|nr:sulfite exporter TauE/SafE family protein [Thermoflexales bacterium]MDW8351632.1 sulfite exporter TauE/SafE family protein [Anaerolineae bacterium]